MNKKKISSVATVVYGKYELTLETILQKLERNKLTKKEKNTIINCLEQEQTVYISGNHGATGKTTLTNRLIELGLDAVEIDIEHIVMMNTPIADR
jgi:Flp pilus assembly CpaF family ATPase